jgi:hypothetical protein
MQNRAKTVLRRTDSMQIEAENSDWVGSGTHVLALREKGIPLIR